VRLQSMPNPGGGATGAPDGISMCGAPDGISACGIQGECHVSASAVVGIGALEVRYVDMCVCRWIWMEIEI